MSATQWQSILVAVGDPNRRQHMAIKKAAEVAQRCGARLTLLHTFAFPYPVQSSSLSSKEVLEHTIAIHHKRLEELAKPLRKRGLAVHSAVEWDFPAHEAIVRYVRKHHPDLVIAESHRHGRLSRWLLSNTDWELIRACLMPLWFVKSAPLANDVSFIAAVDPLHAHAKPSGLDDTIIGFAKHAARALGGAVTLAHAYEEPVVYEPGLMMEPMRLPLAPQRAREHFAKVKSKVAALAKRYRIAPANIIVKQGDPSDVLPALTKQRSTQVVVMGVVSRRGASRVFIGNTAEKVLDRLNCDVIVVKPNQFKTPVPRLHAALRKY